jgi:hypothetical protein
MAGFLKAEFVIWALELGASRQDYLRPKHISEAIQFRSLDRNLTMRLPRTRDRRRKVEFSKVRLSGGRRRGLGLTQLLLE